MVTPTGNGASTPVIPSTSATGAPFVMSGGNSAMASHTHPSSSAYAVTSGAPRPSTSYVGNYSVGSPYPTRMVSNATQRNYGYSTVLPTPAAGSSAQSTSYSTGHNMTTYSTMGHTVQSERVLSSNIVGETMLGPMPQEENVQYIEIPVIEEVIRHVPKREIVEVEKRVPKFEYEWLERVVEVPEVHIVDKTIEVPQIQEVIRHVPVKQIVEIPKEVIRQVPKIETKIVEREVEVPGEIIEVPKPYLVENKIVIPRYTDEHVPTVVSQQLIPVITESATEFVDVELKEYNPYLVAVDVYVPRPVARQLIASKRREEHSIVDIPAAHFNALLKQLNTQVNEQDLQELFVRDVRGAIPLTPLPVGSAFVSPVVDDAKLIRPRAAAASGGGTAGPQ